MRRASRPGEADHDHATVVWQSFALYPALLLQALDEQRHRGLRDPLELGELGDPSRPFAEDAQDLHFGAGDLAAAHLLDEQPHKHRGARGQLLGDVVDSFGPLGLVAILV